MKRRLWLLAAALVLFAILRPTAPISGPHRRPQGSPDASQTVKSSPNFTESRPFAGSPTFQQRPGVPPGTDPIEVERLRPKAPQVPSETNELLIFLKPGVDAEAFAKTLGIQLKAPLVGVPDIYVFSAETPAAATAALMRAQKDERVALAGPNQRTQHIHCAFVPNDPYFPNNSPAPFHGQWHLGNGASTTHANLAGPWNNDVTGTGVLIGIVDDCLETAHPDLAPNFVAADSFNFGNGTADPSPNPAYDGTGNEDRHGTSVSGVAAARGGNGTGVTGAAPLAGLAGLRIDFPAQTTAMFVNATLYHSSGGNTNIKVKNHSYAVPATYIPATLESNAVNTSAGAGTIHCFAAGNARGTFVEDSNKTEPQNNPNCIAVAAIASNGVYSGYSSFGANVFVAAPSNGVAGFGILTTDRVGNHGYNVAGDSDSFADTNYTSAFGGTSSATPLTAGIMALGKQVRPALNVRFAKHALARSCRQVDPNDSTQTGGGDGATAGSAWKANAVGFRFNQNYGFGMIDADEFITQLQQMTGIGPLTTESTGTIAVGLPIPDGSGTGVTQNFTLSTPGRLEEIVVHLTINHAVRGQLEAYLTSPSGTKRRLFFFRNDDTNPDIDWSFVTNEFWGENPVGLWSLQVVDLQGGPPGPGVPSPSPPGPEAKWTRRSQRSSPASGPPRVRRPPRRFPSPSGSPSRSPASMCPIFR